MIYEKEYDTMTDIELRAHNLAVAFSQNLHPELNKQLDSSTLEFLCQSFLEDYEAAYEYFQEHMN